MLRNLILFAMLSQPVLAQQAPPCSAPAFRQFDFWLGKWEVSAYPDGEKPLGTNRIESKYGGCLIEENWTSANGGDGTSLNYFDPVDRLWHQQWVAAGYSLHIKGGLSDGAMRLAGTIHYHDARGARSFRGIWTALPNGDVRQMFEEQDPQTGAWSLWFDGRYRRANSD